MLGHKIEVSLLLVVERGEVGISTIRKINFCEVKEHHQWNQSKTDEWICSIKMPMRVWVSITKVFNNSLLRISKLQIKIDHV